MIKPIARWATSFVLLLAAFQGLAASPPTLRIAVGEGGLTLSWDPVGEGQGVTVETTSRLAPADWTPLGPATDWPSAGTNWSGPLPSAGTAYFRLVVAPTVVRGALESQALLRSFTQPEMLAIVQEYGVPFLIPTAVDAWKIVYSTIDALGQPTRASALVAVPAGSTRALPLMSYQHGTITQREDVPSRLNEEANLGLILASAGYASVLPDYLGLGDSPGLHPYVHARSEATAVVDALRGARALMQARGINWNQQLFLTGYSQGGHATLAAQREIEQRHATEFTITASAPGAGPYDLSGVTTTDFLSMRRPPNPYYTAYLLASYVEVYGLAPSLADLLREPYARTVPPLLDGQHDGGEINAVLPPRPADMLKPEILEAFTADLNHPLRLALRDNDLHAGWVPRSPTRLYHCKGDSDVPFANSEVAAQTFKAAGATTVELIDPYPAGDHGDCVPFALLGTKFWFDSLKK